MRQLTLLVAVFALSGTAAQARVDRAAINRAIDRGVLALKKAQSDHGTWHTEVGATALAGLTLLECGVAKDDPAVKSAAAHVRKAMLTHNKTYCLACSILFLDRLDAASDTPLIESMIVRLLAGQSATGCWSYNCPNLAEEEMKRIIGEMDGTRVLRAGGDLKKMPAKGSRTARDLPEAIRNQLLGIARAGGGAGGPALGGDNSNTQFAVLALWVGRRYGVPTQPGLVRAYEYFRKSQNADGGWAYMSATMGFGSSATMTCAGVLALAVGQGAALDIKKEKNPKLDSADVSKDIGLRAGLLALGTAIGVPLGWDGIGPRPAAIPTASGKSFYFLWSLERIAVAMGLNTIGKKDWYNWGAEILLANQRADGHWAGDYSTYHADTCFALLFLKRSNLTGDLGDKLKGLRDPGEKVLKAGGVGGGGIRASTGGLGGSGIGEKTAAKPPEKGTTPPERPTLKPPPRTAEERAARDLAGDLTTARGERRGEIIEKLRDTRGVVYTEALADVIPRLDGDLKREARQALTLRLTRMKDSTLGDYLDDEDAEIRRAAALACGTKRTKAHTAKLVRMLRDREDQVSRAAHAALKAISGQAFDLDPAAWEKWWKETGRE